MSRPCLRLVGELLIENDEGWHMGKRYLDMNVENNTPVLQRSNL